MNAGFTSIITAPSSGLNSGSNNALSKHLANKSIERLFDKQSNPVNTSNNFPTGLPPRSQNMIQRDSNVERSIGSNMIKYANNNTQNILRRNFSTNLINNVDDDNDESRDLLEPRKSISSHYKNEIINKINKDNAQINSVDNTFQVANWKSDRDSSLENPDSIRDLANKILSTKGANSKVRQAMIPKNQFTLKSFTGKNGLALGRTLSRGKLLDTGYKGPQINIKELLSKGDATIQKHKQGSTIGNITFNHDSITPK